jgi:hypothetical protein
MWMRTLADVNWEQLVRELTPNLCALQSYKTGIPGIADRSTGQRYSSSVPNNQLIATLIILFIELVTIHYLIVLIGEGF